MTEPLPPEKPGLIRRIIAAIFMVMGWSTLLSAGSCGVVFILQDINTLADLGMIAAFTLPPLGLGALLAWGGRRLWGREKPRPPVS